MHDAEPAPNPAPGLAAQLAFERALMEISSRVAGATAETVVDEIRAALARLLGFLDVDRSSFFEILDDGSVHALCTVAVDGVEPMPVGPVATIAPWYVAQIVQGRTLAFTSLPDGLPPQAAAEAEYSRRIGMRANLSVPLRLAGVVRFGIAAGAFRDVRGWSPEMLGRLTLVGEVFAQTLARTRTEARLSDALAQVSALKERVEAENSYLREAARVPTGAESLRSHSRRFLEAVDLAARVAETRSTVLLLGETGTGKELMAATIHAASPRRERTMVRLNCAALPPTLIEAELFGRERGAYTGALTRQVGRFELAHGSTIFLDEVGELPIELQPKLLRVLQEGEFERVGGTQTIRVDVRVIAATNRSLIDEVRAGRFREDLYYRLDVFPIELPPLRERTADVPMLVWRFVQEFSQALGRRVDRIPDETMRRLQAYDWPGNIRELRNLVERAMILCRDGVLEVALPAGARDPADEVTDGASRREIEATLVRCGWRVRGEGGAAERLGLKPTTLEWRMKKLGIVRPR